MSRVKTLTILGAHGLSGAVRAFLFFDFDREKPIFGIGGERYNIVSFCRSRSSIAVISFRECRSRMLAESWKGVDLFQDVELGEFEFFISDLVGKFVSIGSGSAEITGVVNYGAGDILELRYRGKEVLIPFRREFFVLSGENFCIDEQVFLSFYNL